MKVVDSNPHPSVIKYVVCKNCGATLECVPNDIKRKIVTDYAGGKDVYDVVTCCVCNKDNYVSL